MNISIYCDTQSGNYACYVQEARRLGIYLANNKINLVYSGGSGGLSGIVANAVLEGGGTVHGVILEGYQPEGTHSSLTTYQYVKSISERKALISSLSDAFVALPGGVGVIGELLDIWASAEMNKNSKPCALYNTHGYYDPMFSMIKNMADSGFIDEKWSGKLIQTDEPFNLINLIKSY